MQSSHDLLASFSRSSLGLLLALDALLEERSVSGAAARCGMTQSGMSHALSQLRQMLGDELLVRSGNRMHLTPRAERMAAQLRLGLGQLERSLAAEAVFDPTRAERVVRIATSDAAAIVIAPPLAHHLRSAAPGIQLEIMPLDLGRMPGLLELGEIDLVITVAAPDRPSLLKKRLYSETFVCLLRRGHPALAKKWGLDEYLRLDHAVIGTASPGMGVIDGWLERLGHRRRIQMRIGYFLVAPLIVAQTDLVVTIPSQTATLLAQRSPVEIRPFPLPQKAGPICMVWHERFKGDPVSRWLRSVVERIARQTSGGSSKRELAPDGRG